MYYFVEVACVFAEVCIIHWLLTGMFQKRELPRWAVCLIYGLYGTALTLLSFVDDLSFWRITFNLCAIWLLGFIMFQSGPFRSFFSALMICALAAFADVMVSTLLLHFGYNIRELMTIGPKRALYLIATHIVLFALSACLYILSVSRSERVSLKFLVPVLPCWACGALLCIILAWQLLGDQDVPPLYLGVLLGMLYTDIMFVYQMNKLSAQEQEKQEWKLAEHHYAMQTAYYDQFRIQQEETRALWHDIRKLLQAAKLEGCGDTLDQVEEMLHAVTGVVDVDNRTVSVILNEYAQTASQEGIQLHLDVQIPRELSVTAADLYILLGNTLDNAIEACTALPPEQREITVKLKTHNHILFYEIENPYVPSYVNRIRGGLHGYGLQNVRRCVGKYQGTLEIQKGDKIFRVIAHMNTYQK